MRKKSLVGEFIFFVLLLSYFGVQTFSQEKCKQDQSQWRHFNIQSGVSFEYEKSRLHVAANHLKLCPNKIVYLIGLNSVKKKKSTIEQRLKKSKQYLITKHKISSKRIIIVYGGTDSEIRMYIYFEDK